MIIVEIMFERPEVVRKSVSAPNMLAGDGLVVVRLLLKV